MADPNFSWIYILIFLAIPLARIIPRLLAKRGIGKSFFPPQQQQQQPNQFESHSEEYLQKSSSSSPSSPSPPVETSKPQSKNDLVLGVLHRGSNSFESIKKNTGLDNEELDSILEDLEKNELLKIVHKQGMLGPKTELYPTDKGFKEYYS